MTEPMIIKRPMEESDKPFVFSSWLRSYQQSRDVCGVIAPVYYKEQHYIIERLLLRPIDVVVLASEEDPATVIGWMASSQTWLHYLYIKYPFRRMGLAKSLVGDPERWSCYTHRTPVLNRLKLPPKWDFNPYRAYLT